MTYLKNTLNLKHLKNTWKAVLHFWKVQNIFIHQGWNFMAQITKTRTYVGSVSYLYCGSDQTGLGIHQNWLKLKWMHFNVCKFYLNKFGPPPKQNKLLKLHLCTLLFFFTFNHFFCTLKNTITAYMHSSITNLSRQKLSISPGI